MAFDFKKEYKAFYLPKDRPDFVKREGFDWAVREASQKKKLDCSAAAFYPRRA